MKTLAWTRASDWVLTRCTDPPTVGKRISLTLVVIILFAIGLADYASGIRVSLTVFYLVPILLAVAWFGRVIALGIVGASVLLRLTGDSIANDEQALPLWIWWNAFSAMVVFVFLVWVFSSLLELRRRLEQRVAERTAQLMQASEHRRLLEHQLLSAGLNERQQIGQELHDDICQHLVGTTLAAKVLSQRLAQQGNPLSSEALQIIELIEGGIAKTRQLARGLLLSEIDPAHLVEKLGELVDEGSRSGIPCRFRHAGDVLVGDPGIAAQMYRIAQEALRNALRHAQATRIEIALFGDDKAICLMVEDDGRGLPDAKGHSGMGLPILMQRAAYIGATLTIVPTPDRGTRMLCHLPVA